MSTPTHAPATPKALAVVVKSGTCRTCSRNFTWEAKGGRGRDREFCSTICADVTHNLARLLTSMEALTFPATEEGREMASDLRGQLFLAANQFQDKIPHAVRRKGVIMLPAKAKAAAPPRHGRVSRLDVATVACPECHAVAGAACVKSRGGPRASLHTSQHPGVRKPMDSGCCDIDPTGGTSWYPVKEEATWPVRVLR
jgi:endogenous inhibitor of DNA gyrase (YacG/DUF329 family)